MTLFSGLFYGKKKKWEQLTFQAESIERKISYLKDDMRTLKADNVLSQFRIMLIEDGT